MTTLVRAEMCINLLLCPALLSHSHKIVVVEQHPHKVLSPAQDGFVRCLCGTASCQRNSSWSAHNSRRGLLLQEFLAQLDLCHGRPSAEDTQECFLDEAVRVCAASRAEVLCDDFSLGYCNLAVA